MKPRASRAAAAAVANHRPGALGNGRPAAIIRRRAVRTIPTTVVIAIGTVAVAIVTVIAITTAAVAVITVAITSGTVTVVIVIVAAIHPTTVGARVAAAVPNIRASSRNVARRIPIATNCAHLRRDRPIPIGLWEATVVVHCLRRQRPRRDRRRREAVVCHRTISPNWEQSEAVPVGDCSASKVGSIWGENIENIDNR